MTGCSEIHSSSLPPGLVLNAQMGKDSAQISHNVYRVPADVLNAIWPETILVC